MTPHDDPLEAGGRVGIVDRLAALQRLRDQAAAGNRVQMLQALNRMIDAEMRALQRAREMDAGHDAGRDTPTA